MSDGPVRINRVTTRGGDTGQSSLADGQRLPKYEAIFMAIGAVDELNSHIGLLAHDSEMLQYLLRPIQHDLFDLGAALASPRKPVQFSPARVEWLDAHIAEMSAGLTELRSFILPGGTRGACQAHICRTVARRAEADVWAVAERYEGAAVLGQYLNRLSDLLFQVARRINGLGKYDVLWAPNHAGL